MKTTSLAPAAPDAPDDVELARRVGCRDERAFELLMRRHNRTLYRIARAILRDDAEAEDAVQNAYLAAFRNIAAFRGGSRLATWLARIAINESYALLRKRKRAGVVLPFDPGVNGRRTGERDLEEDAMTDAEQPEAAASRAEVRRLLERNIDALPDQFRTAFILREVEEMSVDEAAACLGVPAATVRSRTFRARALLREAMAREIDVATVHAFGFAGERCDRIVAGVLARWREPG
ncbi:MAG TPA: RNA polymerase sigma factor [Casimicrobiaceae bacterium]|jgi:RNA polymerase sigma-70 factor (ECF subfamily)|nr:RNA polymerase sigma factor [Casimicrobiaceae bacterium]